MNWTDIVLGLWVGFCVGMFFWLWVAEKARHECEEHYWHLWRAEQLMCAFRFERWKREHLEKESA